MPPLNTTLIRGCSELQGPATQEWLWHGSDFVAPSLCSLLGPITPHRSFLPSFFLELFWWEGWMKVRRLRREGAMDALALPAAEMSDRGTEDSGYSHLAPNGPGRHTELSPHRGAISHASLHAIDLAEDFRGVFFYLCYILPVSPRCELWGSRIRFRIMVHFFSSPACCLLWHAIPSHKHQGPVAYPSC